MVVAAFNSSVHHRSDSVGDSLDQSSYVRVAVDNDQARLMCNLHYNAAALVVSSSGGAVLVRQKDLDPLCASAETLDGHRDSIGDPGSERFSQINAIASNRNAHGDCLLAKMEMKWGDMLH